MSTDFGYNRRMDLNSVSAPPLQNARPRAPGSTGGRRIYAVGDIHGCLNLLDPLLDRIREDAFVPGEHCPGQGRPAGKPVLVFVGDYIDRGRWSKGVIERLIALGDKGEFELRALKGNHEEALLAFLADPNMGPAWCEHGGTETLASYGVAPPILRMDDKAWADARDAFAAALPAWHLCFLAQLELTAVYGDYVFVHAGVRPGLPIEAQSETDLLWIRQAFLNAPGPFGKIVVHGHTPAEQAFLGPHRIGIDTGAYATGVLTCVRLEDGDSRFIQQSARSSRAMALPRGAISA
jgi:serine/threonine protein phosphatase 1